MHPNVLVYEKFIYGLIKKNKINKIDLIKGIAKELYDSEEAYGEKT